MSDATVFPDDDFVSVDAARLLIKRSLGRRATRERVFVLGVEGEIAMKKFAGRWFVSRASIESWHARQEGA